VSSVTFLETLSETSVGRAGAHALLERVIEGNLVEEDIGIVELFVESILHLLHATQDTVDVTVPCCVTTVLVGNEVKVAAEVT
jgi:hypothetical protein